MLVNTHDSDQRGLFVDVPGRLVDILPDPRTIVARSAPGQEPGTGFDATQQHAGRDSRTSNTPPKWPSRRTESTSWWGHNDAQIISVFDLDTLKPDPSVFMPFGHYPRSIAVSGARFWRPPAWRNRST